MYGATTSASNISRKCVIKPVVDVTAFSIRDVLLPVSELIRSSMPLNRHLET